MLSDLKKLPYKEGFNMLGMWSLEELRNRAIADLIELFKMVKGFSAVITSSHHFFSQRRSDEAFLTEKFSQRSINRWNLTVFLRKQLMHRV